MRLKKAWSDLILKEIKNPKTFEVELNREVTFNDGLPVMNLHIKIKQSADINEFGTEQIHKLAATIPPLGKTS